MSNPLEGQQESPKKGPAQAEAPAAEPVARQEGARAAAPRPPDETLTAAVDTLAHPILAVLADGLLLHANLAAHELLKQGAPLELGSDQRVVPRLVGQRASFASAVQAASKGQPQQLAWADGELTVHAALRPLAEPTPGTPSPPVLVILAPPPEAAFDASGFANTYGLSSAETRVLEALLHGRQAEATAQRLGVGVATVRSQIASIRRKTGHDSVASLLAALGDLPPLRHPGR